MDHFLLQGSYSKVRLVSAFVGFSNGISCGLKVVIGLATVVEPFLAMALDMFRELFGVARQKRRQGYSRHAGSWRVNPYGTELRNVTAVRQVYRTVI
jgi:hypothetical protein